jgi:hypothetical protein
VLAQGITSGLVTRTAGSLVEQEKARQLLCIAMNNA